MASYDEEELLQEAVKQAKKAGIQAAAREEDLRIKQKSRLRQIVENIIWKNRSAITGNLDQLLDRILNWLLRRFGFPDDE